MSGHALLSASGAHRWLRCTRSARLTEGLPDRTGVAAQEGTLAHALAEAKLRHHFCPAAFGKKELAARVKELKKILDDWGEMCKGCAEKSDYIRKINELMPKYAPKAASARTDL